MTDHPFDLAKRANTIRNTAEGFCKAFAAGEPPHATLDKFFTPNPTILEHGPKTDTLPFLGTTFTGRRSNPPPPSPSPLPSPSTHHHHHQQPTCDDYYSLLTSILSFDPNANTVPPKAHFLVDPTYQGGGGGAVTIKLHATFASIKTGKSWEEDFVYILSEFDDEGTKIGRQEIWADPLSAFMAVNIERDR